MRTDVKLGVLAALAIVMVAGVYFFFDGEEPVNLDESLSAGSSLDGNAEHVAREDDNSRRADGDAAMGEPSPPSNTNFIPTRIDGDDDEKPDVADEDDSLTKIASADHDRDSNVAEEVSRMMGRVSDGGASAPDSSPSDAADQPPGGERPTVPSRFVRAEAPTEAEISNAAVEHHKIVKGDTLAGLAMTYLGSEAYVDVLLRANPQIKDPTNLQIGDRIAIPAEGGEASLVAMRENRSTKRRASETDRHGRSARRGSTASHDAEADREPQADVYVVQEGDSFWSIAESKLGSGPRWEELFKINRDVVGGDPKGLKPGQKLRLPAS